MARFEPRPFRARTDLTDEQIARWPEASDVFGGTIHSFLEGADACSHLVADVGSGEPVMAFTCAEHGHLYCVECVGKHAEADVELGCLVPRCVQPAWTCEPTSWFVGVEGITLLARDLQAWTVAPAVGLVVNAPLCRRHGGGREWSVPERIHYRPVTMVDPS